MENNDFGIITKSSVGDKISIELSFSDDEKCDEPVVIKKKETDFPNYVINSLGLLPMESVSLIATRIIRNKWTSFKCHNDFSNHIIDGREVIITNKITERSYCIFNSIMFITKNEELTDINMAITYACRIVSEEYIKEWQDKQYLVLIILRMYIKQSNCCNKSELYLKIDSYVPIYVEKILHPTKLRLKWYNWYRCCKW
jgi:hypothetical protein